MLIGREVKIIEMKLILNKQIKHNDILTTTLGAKSISWAVLRGDPNPVQASKHRSSGNASKVESPNCRSIPNCFYSASAYNVRIVEAVPNCFGTASAIIIEASKHAEARRSISVQKQCEAPTQQEKNRSRNCFYFLPNRMLRNHEGTHSPIMRN